MRPSAIGSACALLLTLAASARPVTAQTSRATASATVAPANADMAAVRAIEQGIWDAVASGNWDTAHGYLDGAVFMNGGQVIRWSREVTDARRAMNCTVRRHALDDMQMEPVGADVMLVTYRITLDMACPGVPALPPMYYMSVFHRKPGGWKLRATAVSPVAAPPGGR